jgi:lysine-specific demethylase/histidyl-hydroxylase NO66
VKAASLQEFNTHYHPHDVIVLQLAGEKRPADLRLLHRPAILEPGECDTPAGRVPFIAIRLKQGDSLYVPYGFVHSAVSADQSSLHVSIGIYAAMAGDMLRYALNELTHSPALAQPL